MNPAETCVTCKFFHGINSNQSGECRRIPPVTIVVGYNSDGEAKASVRFPPVALTWWCGEHVPRLVVLS